MRIHHQLWDGLANRLEVVLQQHLGGRVPDLHVDLQEQGLILRGHTATYYVKQLAQHAAAQLTGLPVLANDIEVR
jgi:hypothetical protein